MAIDFTLAPEHEEIRSRVRAFIQDTVVPRVKGFDDESRVTERHEYLVTILELREEAKREGLWLPHMPKEWGGMGLGHVELAMVQAEAAKTGSGGGGGVGGVGGGGGVVGWGCWWLGCVGVCVCGCCLLVCVVCVVLLLVCGVCVVLCVVVVFVCLLFVCFCFVVLCVFCVFFCVVFLFFFFVFVFFFVFCVFCFVFCVVFCFVFCFFFFCFVFCFCFFFCFFFFFFVFFLFFFVFLCFFFFFFFLCFFFFFFFLFCFVLAAVLWLPHMPKEWGGMGLGHVELAMVQAESGKTRLGPWILNCMAPDEGNMHTLLHWGTEEQKEKYLRRLCEGTAMSCFAMTEPEVAGSDPTLIQTRAEKDGDEWIINGHKWFISNARRAQFAILIARTEPDVPPAPAGPTPPSSSTSRRRAGTTCARSRRCTARPATPRS